MEKDSASGKRSRDTLRRVALGMNFVIVGIENQEEPDYKINVIEIRNLEHTEVFQTDVKQVFEFIRLSGDKKALLKLVESDDSYQHMDEDAFEVITTYTNSKELRKQMEKVQQKSKEKGEKKDMCKAIRDLIEDSKAEGREFGLAEGISRGREEGHAQGMADGRIIMLRCFFSNGGSEEDAIRMLAATKEEIESAGQMV